MRDGLRTLTDIVDRIEGGGVVVDDAAISRAGDDEIVVDISVRFPDDGEITTPVGDGGSSADEGLYRGGRTETPPTVAVAGPAPESDGCAHSNGASSGARTVSPEFGATSARVGGSVAGALAEAAATAGTAARGGTNGSVDGSAGTVEGRTRGRDGETRENGSGSPSSDGLVTCRVDGCDERFETDHGMKIHATKAHQSADGSAPSPHRDPDRLREVYEACDTFEEMTAALDVDVTPQTVRRSMMRLGVHDPSADDRGSSPLAASAAGTPRPSDVPTDRDEGTDASRGTTDDSTDDPPPDVTAGSLDEDRAPDQAEPQEAEPQEGVTERNSGDDRGADESDGGADGSADTTDGSIDPADEPDEAVDGPTEPDVEDDVLADVDAVLPAEVDGEALVDAVRTANTLYEVQRRLDMDREAVQTLLAELDLLDLVHGRVATQGEREEQKAEIERRILERVGEPAEEQPGDGPGEQARAD